MRRPVEFEAASRTVHASRGHYLLTPREAYVLQSAPVRGLSQPERRRREGTTRGSWMMWFVGEENLSNVVEGLLQRGLLARRGGEGPVYADLTAEGRRAIDVGQIKSFR
jgi:hypothetical protein